jgi:hypothetical protein
MLGGYTITATVILGISTTIKEEIITIYRQLRATQLTDEV